ncbi:hypothetical protein [Paenibacillus hunanensis]|uniref:Phage abortive infection protein n=1 Tax=Paenibacillus hunanensis TaxID=539262 RepID=A0ABU1IX46_9BACL|nr:hypothetical protein [Paenibacillus hunanensis]MDR6243496.1 hypothetical protein [Paenibacillus hunanensis]GGI98179.1 hypothetical protein GCM10008022_03580 [Paenibacillus hunanensis]
MTTEEKVEQKKEEHKIFKIGGSVLVIWGISFWAINRFVNSDYRGIFGDMFGAVNALFSGLAFAGLIYTITVQRKELSLQREAIQMQTKELEAQHIETARSADQLQMQQELLNYQLVLATVNDLLKLKNAAIQNINTHNGADQFTNRFKNWVTFNKVFDGENLKNLEQYKETCFLTLHFVITSNLRNKQIFKLIDIVNVNIDATEKKLLTTLAIHEKDLYIQNLLKVFKIYQEK